MMAAIQNQLKLGICAAHLGVVLLGAAYFPFSDLGRVGSALKFYGTLSGAGSTYGFFTSPIDGQVRARFEYIDREGNRKSTRLGSGTSHEVDLRVDGMFGEFIGDEEMDQAESKKYQRSLAASLAGSVFGRHPEAEKVFVNLDEYWPVSMDEYRQGIRSEWKPIYEFTFVRANQKRPTS